MTTGFASDSIPTTQRKFLVHEKSCWHSTSCPGCHKIVLHEVCVSGTSVKIWTTCFNDHVRLWESQPTAERTSVGNLMVAGGILYSDLNPKQDVEVSDLHRSGNLLQENILPIPDWSSVAYCATSKHQHLTLSAKWKWEREELKLCIIHFQVWKEAQKQLLEKIEIQSVRRLLFQFLHDSCHALHHSVEFTLPCPGCAS